MLVLFNQILIDHNDILNICKLDNCSFPLHLFILNFLYETLFKLRILFMSFALGFHNDLKEIVSLETHSLDCLKVAFYLSYNHFNPTVSKSVRNEEMKMNRAVICFLVHAFVILAHMCCVEVFSLSLCV